MIHLSNLVTGIKQVDPVWTFSHYCNISPGYFNGSTIKIKSIFTEEKTPSLCIYLKGGKPRFKCFSSSYQGDHIDLVQAKFKMNFSQSCQKIVSDYNKWILNNKEFVRGDLNENNKYRVSAYEQRKWNTIDRSFWTPYGIGSQLLEWGNVVPLLSFTMTKENTEEELYFNGENTYGYFAKTGELYKIYCPMKHTCKFISVAEHDAGSEHDQPGNEFVILLSSWKDALCFKTFGLKLDMRIPPSENSWFAKEYVENLKKKYKKVITLFDADDAGKKAMLHYKNEYDLDFIWLPLSKDISDSIKDYSKETVFNRVVPMIHKILN